MAQLPFGAPLDYPSVVGYGYDVGTYGSYPFNDGMSTNQGISIGTGSSYGAQGNLGYGGFGTSPYNYAYGNYGVNGPNPFSVYGYGVTNGALVGNLPALGASQGRPGAVSPPPQPTRAIQPVFDVVTAAPSWYRTAHPRRALARSKPRVPREQLIGEDGTVHWPTAAPDDPAASDARRAAEGAVKEAFLQAKNAGRASVRQVLEAKKKLNTLARESLPKLKQKNPAAADAVESFIVELEKTLQSMADHY